MTIICYYFFILFLLAGAPPLYNPSSPPIRLQRPLDPPPYASSEATPMRLDPAPSSAYQDNSYSPRHHHGVIQQTQYRDVVGQSLPESSLSPAPPPSNSQYGNRDIGREGYQSDHHRTKLVFSSSLSLSLSLSLSPSLSLPLSLPPSLSLSHRLSLFSNTLYSLLQFLFYFSFL